MLRDKLSTYLRILLTFILIITPYILSKLGNHSRNTGTIILVVVSLIYIIVAREKIFTDKKIIILGLLYIIFTTLSFFKLNGNYNNEQLKTYVGTIMYILLFFCIKHIDIDNRLYRWIPVMLAFFSVFPAMRAIQEWGKQNFSMNYRVFGDSWPSIFCMELGILILASIVVIYFEKNWFFKILSIVTLVIGFIAIVGVQARIAIILLPVFFILTALVKDYKIGIKMIIGLSLCMMLIVSTDFERYFKRFNTDDPSGNYSNLVRVEIYKRNIELIKQNFWTGIGFYNLRGKNITDEPRLAEYTNIEDFGFKKEIPGTLENLRLWSFSATHTHNNIMEVLITEGFFGFISYLLFTIFIFKDLINNFRNKKFSEYRGFFWLGIIAFLYVFIDGIIDANIYMIKLNQTLYLILGMCLNKKFMIGNSKEKGDKE